MCLRFFSISEDFIFFIRSVHSMPKKNSKKETSSSDKWQTSDRYLEVLYKFFQDDLTLDVTSPMSSIVKYSSFYQGSRINEGDKRIKSEYYYTELENCLIRDFIEGNWFMNCPFSNPLEFLEKLVFEHLKTQSSAVVLLKSGCIHNKGTSPIIWDCASAICFHTPRLEFYNENLQSVNGADFDCITAYFGSDNNKFVNDFSVLGECRNLN